MQLTDPCAGMSVVFSGDAPDLAVTGAGSSDFSVAVSVDSSTLMTFTMTPHNGSATIKLSRLLDSALPGHEVQSGLETSEFEVPLVTVAIGSLTWSHRVIRGRRPASAQVPGLGLMTVRPQRSVTYKDGKEIMYFVKGVHDNGTTWLQCRVYFASGNSADITIPAAALNNSAVPAIVSVDCSYKVVRGRCDAAGLTSERVTGWSVRARSSYTETDSAGNSASKTESGDWQHFSLRDGRHYTYVFRNRSGAFDTIYATGERKLSSDPDTSSFINSDREREVSAQALRSREQNSGYVWSTEAADAWNDFLASPEKYVYEDGTLRGIVYEESDYKVTENELSYLTFSWHYSDRTYAPAPDRTEDAGDFWPDPSVYPSYVSGGGSGEGDGSGSGDKTFWFVQTGPSALWVVEHGLGKRPSVAVVDSTGTEIVGSVTYDADDPLNRLTISFSEAVSGAATLN